MSTVSTCLVCNSSIVATCPSYQLPALLSVCVLFVLFFLFVVVVSGEPKQKQGRGLVDHKLTGQWICITAQRLSFMVSTRHLYIGDTDISHLCHNALYIRVDHLSTEPHEPMNERIKGASHDKGKSHEAYPFSCI